MLLSPFKYSPFSASRFMGFTITRCSYYFDNIAVKINMGNILNTVIGGTGHMFTIRIVFKLQTIGGTWLFGKWNATGNQRAYVVFMDADNKLNIFMSSNGTAVDGKWISTNTIIADGWHDLIVGYNNGITTVYLDGVVFAGTVVSGPIMTIFNSSSDYFTGGYTAGVFSGYINQSQVTSDFITLQESEDLWNNGSPRLGSDILDNIELDTIFDNDTFDGSDWTVINTVGANGITENMIAVDHDCNENPY